MSTKYTNSTSIASGLRITSKSPTDDRIHFSSVEEARKAIKDEFLAKRFHDGIEVFISDNPGNSETNPEDHNYIKYIWQETTDGLFDTPYQYVANEFPVHYRNKTYNLVLGEADAIYKVFATAGLTQFKVPARFLPSRVRATFKASSVIIYEPSTTVNPEEEEVTIPNNFYMSKNGLSGEVNLIINVAPSYEVGTAVTIKIS